MEGVFRGFEEAALVEGRDYEAKFVSAQGDIATASSMVDAAASDGTELIVSLTTPMLQACLRRSRGIPVVFTLVANPVLAGAGKSNTDHLPNVAGNYVVSPFARMMRAVRECLPNARRVGTLFAPAEVNSVFYKDKLVEAAREVGIEVEDRGGEHGERGSRRRTFFVQHEYRRNVPDFRQPDVIYLCADRASLTAIPLAAVQLQHDPLETRLGANGRTRLLRWRPRGGPDCSSSHAR